jgi:predicted dienelactone hydrolase
MIASRYEAKPRSKMRRSLRRIFIVLSSLLVTAPAWATDAGFRQMLVPSSPSTAPPIPVALYYPTQAQARPIAMGPFTAHVAIQGPADETVRGLIVLSHGRGGTEVGYTSLAEALARHGYLVASLRHPGDNWQDRSLLQQSAARYFTERPQDASRVIDALLHDPEWGRRIAKDDHGPRIGAIGHSAGGYTVLALAGAEPELSKSATHCRNDRLGDPIFCGIAAREGPPVPISTPIPSLVDARVRAVAALSPLGVVFTSRSLARIQVPVLVYEAELDRFLVPRFHAEWIARNVSGSELRRVPNAWHFAFMDPPSTAIATEDGDLAADPPGFDRPAFLVQLGQELSTFFDKALR